MKKVALSFLALLAAGSMAFADVTQPTVASPVTVAVSASGSATFGFDLDTGSSGFTNAADAAIVVGIVKGSAAKGDQGGVISVADLVLSLKVAKNANALNTASNDFFKVGDVVAKIVVGDLYVKLAQFGDTSVSKAGDSAKVGKVYSGSYGATEGDLQVKDGVSINPTTTTGGVEVGYMLSGLGTLTVNLNTLLNLTAGKATATANVQAYEYAVGFALDGKMIEGVSAGAQFIGSTAAKSGMGLGVNAGYAMGALLGLNVGVDLDLTAGAATSTGVLVGVTSSPIKGLNITSGTTVALGKATVIGEAFGLGVTKDLLQVVSADVGVVLADVSKATAMQIYFNVGGSVDILDFYVKGSQDGGAKSLFAKAGVSTSKLVENVTFSADYNSQDLSATGTAAKLGKFEITAKVTL